MSKSFTSFHIIPKLNEETQEVAESVRTVKRVASRNGIPVVDVSGINEGTLSIVLGGDGTMLEGMRRTARYGGVVMGVNLGNVGFLTDFSARDSTYPLEYKLQGIIEDCDTLEFEERILINWKSHIAANEFIISNKRSDGLISYSLKIGNMDAGEHKATSLIIGSPSGSTAYSLAAGGGLILPSMGLFQILPLAPMSMSSRPIIVPSYEEIKICVKSKDEICVRFDGQIAECPPRGEQLVFTQFPHKARILHNLGWNFFDMLSTKLSWKNKF
jgi:NAD+ kinase